MTLNTPNINHSITTDTSVNADAKHSVTPTGSFSFIETQADAKAYAKYGDVLTGSFNIIGSNAGIKIAKYELVDINHTILSKVQVNAFALHSAPDNLISSIFATGQVKLPELNNNTTGNVLDIITKIGGAQHYQWLQTTFVYHSIRATVNTNVYFKEAAVSTATDIINVQAGVYIPIGRYNTRQVDAWYSSPNNPTLDKRVLGYYNGEFVFGLRLRKFIGTDIKNEISIIAHVTAEKGSRIPQVEQSITAHGDATSRYRGNTDVVITNDHTIITEVDYLAIVKDVAFDEPSITITALSESTAHAKHAVTNNIVETLSVIHNVNYKQGENITVGHNEYISSSSAGVKLEPYKLVEPIQEIINSDAHAVGHAASYEVTETQHIINGLLSNANALVFANDIHSVIQSITTAMEIIVMEDRPTQDVSDIISATAHTYTIVFNSVVEASEVLEVSSFDAGVYNPKDEELPNVLEQLGNIHGLEVVYDGKAVREKINYVELSDNGYNVVHIDLGTFDKTDVLNTLVDASVYYSGRVIFNLDQTSIHKGDTSYLAIVGDNLETNEQVINITSDGFSHTLYNGKVVDSLYELNIGTQSGADYVYGLDTYVSRTDLIHQGESGVSLYHTGRVTLDYTDSIAYSGGLLKPVVVDNHVDNSENTIMSSANSEQLFGDMLNTTESINSITKQFGLSVDYNGKVTDTLSDSAIYAVGGLVQPYINYGTTEHSDYLTAYADVPHINNPTHYDLSEIIQNILNVSSYDTDVYYSGRIAMGDLEDNIAGTSNASVVVRNYSMPGVIQNISKSVGTSLNFNGKVVSDGIQHTITIDHGVGYYRIVPTEDISETINAACSLGNIIYDVKETKTLTNNINISTTAANTYTKHVEAESNVDILLAVMNVIAQYNGKVPLPNMDNIMIQHGLQHAYGRDAYADQVDNDIYAIAGGLSIVGAIKTVTSIPSAVAVAVANASAYYTGRVPLPVLHSLNVGNFGYVTGATKDSTTTDTLHTITTNISISVTKHLFTQTIIQDILALANTTMSYRAYDATATNAINISTTAANTYTKHVEAESNLDVLLARMDVIVQYNGKAPLPNIDNITGQHGLQHAYGRDAYTDPLEVNIYATADGLSIVGEAKTITSISSATATAIANASAYYTGRVTGVSTHSIGVQYGTDYVYGADAYVARTDNIMVSAGAKMFRGGANIDNTLQNILALADTKVSYRAYNAEATNIINLINFGYVTGVIKDSYTTAATHSIVGNSNASTIKNTPTHNALNTVTASSSNASAYYTGRVSSSVPHSVNVSDFGYVTGPIKNSDTSSTLHTITSNIGISVTKNLFTQNTIQNVSALANTKVSYRAYNAAATNTINVSATAANTHTKHTVVASKIDTLLAIMNTKVQYNGKAPLPSIDNIVVQHGLQHAYGRNAYSNQTENNIYAISNGLSIVGAIKTITSLHSNTATAIANASAYYTGRVPSPILHSVNVSNFGYVTGSVKDINTTAVSHTITSNIGLSVTKHLLTQTTIQSITKVADAIARVKNSTTSSASQSITKIADTTVTYRGPNRSFVFYPIMWDNGSNWYAGQVNALLGDVWHNNNGTLTQVATQTHYWQGNIVDNALFSIRNVTLAAGIEYASKEYTTPHSSLSLVTDSYPTNWTLQGIPSDANERQARIIYRGKVYNVNFNNNGGTGSQNIQYRVNPTAAYSISLSAHIPTRTGYTFTGWTITSGPGTISGNSISMPQWTASNNAYGDINVTANWNINTYTITRTLGTGITSGTISPASYNVTTATFTPTLSGISYSRGYSSYSVSPTIASIPTGSTGNKHYTITGIKTNYTIDINENGGGAVSNPSDYVINPTSSQTKTFTAPTRTNYSIISWSVTGHNGNTPTVSGTSGTVTLTIPANNIGNLTITANWTYTGPYNITMSMGDSTGGYVTPTYYKQNVMQILPLSNPTRPGYTFTGYAFVSNPANAAITNSFEDEYQLSIPANGTGDIVFAPTWSSLSYTITRGTNSSYVTLSSYSYSTSTSSQTRTITYSRTGYEFSYASITRTGTYGGPTPTVSGTTITIPAGSYGAFTVNVTSKGKTIYITLNKQSGTGGTSTITATYSSSISPVSGNITLPTRTSYTFLGYYTATSGGTQRINASGVYVALNSSTYTSNATLYAQWQASGGKTATPTLGTPACNVVSGYNYLKATVKNNDTSTATIRNYGSIVGILAPGATATFTFESGFSTPYSYNVNITATADGKSTSNGASRTGTVSYCIV